MAYVVKNQGGTVIAMFMYLSIAQLFVDAEFNRNGRILTAVPNQDYWHFNKETA